MRILIAEDDPSMAAVLGRLLGSMAREIQTARPDRTLPEKILAWKPDLLVVELALPARAAARAAAGAAAREEQGTPEAEGGVGLLGAIRAVWPLGAVLVLGERPSPALRAQWLEHGADDCLGKPFSLGELRARCGALLRRQAALKAAPRTVEQRSRREPATLIPGALVPGSLVPGALVQGALVLDRIRRQVECDGVVVRLTERETALLEQLMSASGNVVSRTQLRQGFEDGAAPSGTESPGANVVDAHVSAVRRKLRVFPAAPAIETVRGAGYRMLHGEGGKAPEERRDGSLAR
jgi:DNA-binding response OmpR family regulator